jgi:hypothetical protein
MVDVCQRNFYGVFLSWNNDFCWVRKVKHLGNLFETFVEIPTDDAGLCSSPDQAVDNLYVKVLSEPDNVEFRVDIIKYGLQLPLGDISLVVVIVDAVSQENNIKLFNAVSENNVFQLSQRVCKVSATWVTIKCI